MVVGHNQLTGVIPPELGNLLNLKRLALDGNRLHGIIPVELASLKQLEHLNLSHNQLVGELPRELGYLPKLRDLLVEHNQLCGPLPDTLANLNQLQTLVLNDNHMSGEISCGLGMLPNLTEIRLGGNEFTGCVPASWDYEGRSFDHDRTGLEFCELNLPPNVDNTNSSVIPPHIPENQEVAPDANIPQNVRCELTTTSNNDILQAEAMWDNTQHVYNGRSIRGYQVVWEIYGETLPVGFVDKDNESETFTGTSIVFSKEDTNIPILIRVRSDYNDIVSQWTEQTCD